MAVTSVATENDKWRDRVREAGFDLHSIYLKKEHGSLDDFMNNRLHGQPTFAQTASNPRDWWNNA